MKNEWKNYLLSKKKRSNTKRAKEYYNDNNEVLKEKEINKSRELSKEEKGIKREYRRNRYHNV